jgi:hypothetical protein
VFRIDIATQQIIFLDLRFSRTAEGYIHAWVTFLTVLMATIFLVGATWVLGELTIYYESPLAVVLGVLTAFIISFTMWAAFILDAKKSDVFAVTAAYSAVLIVFAGLTNYKSGP